MVEYIRKVQYYETDKMGFVHHSNYIRWFEEARIEFLEQSGYPYEKLEGQGLIAPVLSVSCKYKMSIRFGQTVKITAKLKEYGIVRHRFVYTVSDAATGEVHATGETSHCFLNEKGRVVAIKKIDPELNELFASLLEE